MPSHYPVMAQKQGATLAPLGDSLRIYFCTYYSALITDLYFVLYYSLVDGYL